MAPMRQGTALPKRPAAPSERKLAASGGDYYLMCADPAQCFAPGTSQQIMRHWRYSPASLAQRVPTDFLSAQGMAPSAPWLGEYQPVADHWKQSPPKSRAGSVPFSKISTFVSQLLSSDPFGTGGDHVPYINFEGGSDKVVAITQRQLAFIVANVLMGNTLDGGDGLSATAKRCAYKPHRGFIFSMLSLLAVLSEEIPYGEQPGTHLIAGTPQTIQASDWQQHINAARIRPPKVCVHEGNCHPQLAADFMAGGVPYQAMTDIAGGVVGGGSQLCDLATSQDESVVHFYSEVLAFAFFVSADRYLPTPWVLLGARSYMRGITGQSAADNHCGEIKERNWLNFDIPQLKARAPLLNSTVSVAASSFVAVASISSDSLHQCDMKDAVNNNCYSQRHHLDIDLALWYQAFEATMYHPYIRAAFRAVVQRIGTGPWGAGEWHGDSQQYFLAVMLATSFLNNIGLDYYVYNHFCENPGNQCFVLGSEGCADCIKKSGVQGVNAAYCGEKSLHAMISSHEGRPANALYQSLTAVPGPPGQVFDMLPPPGPASPPQGQAPAAYQPYQPQWPAGIVQQDEPGRGGYQPQRLLRRRLWVAGALAVAASLAVATAMASSARRRRRSSYVQLPTRTTPAPSGALLP